jgi:hypothetical protein
VSEKESSNILQIDEGNVTDDEDGERMPNTERRWAITDKPYRYRSFKTRKITVTGMKRNLCWVQIKKNVALCLTNQALHQKDIWGSGCINPHILEFGVSWRTMDDFTARPLYPQGKSP